MNLLLDSHSLLWFLEDSPELSARARNALSDPANLVFISFATPWEIAIKLGRKKLTLPTPFEELFPGGIRSRGFLFLQSRSAHLYELLRLPHLHQDPFDRLLIAQAIVEGFTMVTRDEIFSKYPVPVLW